MLKNYLVITFRNLYKNRIFALINVLGLGLALAVCIVAYFNHMFAIQFDKYNENFEKIYRLNSFRDMQGRDQEYGLVPATLGLEIKKDIPGIEKSANLFRSWSPVKVDHDIFTRSISYVDPEFLDIFTFNFMSGTKSMIEDKGNVFISQELSEVLFGDDNPLGKTISIFNDENEEYVYSISGVFEDLPDNSSFRIDVLTHADNFLKMWKINDTDWKSWARALFLLVPDPSSAEGITQGLLKYLPVQNKAREDFVITGFKLVPLKEVGGNTREIWSSGLFPGIHPAQVVAPPIMAILLLLIAAFNFANTAIAAAGKRLKEIGLRKMLGGHKKQLLLQFLFENLLITLVALFVGIGISKFLVPAYSSMWDYMDISLSFSEYINFWFFLFALLIIGGFLAGGYPALYISSFRPIAILQGKTGPGSAGMLSMIFLTIQFAISVMALVSGFIYAGNATYQETLDLGYDRDKVIIIPASPEIINRYREALILHPKVLAAAGTQQHIGWGNYRRPVENENQQIEVDVMEVSPDYPKTMGLRLRDGRFFDKSRMEADLGRSILVNHKFVEAFGWTDPIGNVITIYDTTRFTVIGVVDDYFVGGLWRAVEPAMIRLAEEGKYYSLAVRTEAENLPEVLEFCRETWTEMLPNYPFNGIAQEETLQEEKTINKSIKQLFVFLAVVAIILSLIGLYTLVSLNIVSRIKEIGIRKVLGASIGVIIGLLSRRFMLLLLIASVFGAFGAYFLSDMLLDSIWDYYLDMTPGLFIWSILIMFLVAVMTISGLVYKAANQNPVDSLRYE